MRLPASLLFLSLLLATAPGCDGQAPAVTADTGGDIAFLLDGEEWAVGASLEMIYTPGYGYLLLTGWASPENPVLQQSLIFSLPKDLSQRSYPLTTYTVGQNGYFASISEYTEDFPYSTYESIGAGDALVVTRYDSSTGELEATFEGTFTDKNPNRSLPRTLPDTFRVTQGRIQVTLTNPQDVPR